MGVGFSPKCACVCVLHCVRESEAAERTGGSVAHVYSVNRTCIGNTAVVKRQQNLCGNFKHGGLLFLLGRNSYSFTLLLSSDELKQQPGSKLPPVVTVVVESSQENIVCATKGLVVYGITNLAPWCNITG